MSTSPRGTAAAGAVRRGSAGSQNRPASAASRTAWEDNGGGVDNAAYYGSRTSVRDADGDAMGGMESEMYLQENRPSSKTPEPQDAAADEYQPTCWDRFSGGIKAMWSTSQTLEDNTNKELYIKTTLRELVIYVFFLVTLCLLTFGMTSSTMYYYTEAMTTLFLDKLFIDDIGEPNSFREMDQQDDIWMFMKGPLLDGLYWETWYNGRNLTADERGYIYYENKMLGVPRLRQLRVRNGTCTLDSKFRSSVDECYGEFGYRTISRDNFGLGATNSSAYRNSTEWTYASQAELDGSTHSGQLAIYPGGGYTINLGTTKAESLGIINYLMENRWIRRGTRVIFIDFSVYNANINLFCVARLIVEFAASGGIIPTFEFRTVKLIRYVTTMDYFILGCECLYILYTIYYTVEEIIEIKKIRSKYFKSFWNILDFLVLALSYLCIIFSVYRTVVVSGKLDDLLNQPNQYIDFEQLAYWQMQYNNAVAVAVFFSWIKVFKYISFNRTMTHLSTTLSRCGKDLLGFLVMFMIMFLAFAQMGMVMFGTQLGDFSTIGFSFFTLFRIILGDFDYHGMETANSVLGPVYFFLYVFFVFFVLLNMFLAIIKDTYADVKSEDEQNAENRVDFDEYFKKGYKAMIGKLASKKEKIMDMEEMLRSADANGDQQLDFSEWRNDLKKRGYADTEIEAMFAKYDTDGDRCLDPDEQRQLADDLQRQKKALFKETEAGNYDEDEKENKEGEEGKEGENGESERPSSARVVNGDDDDDLAADDDNERPSSTRGSAPRIVKDGVSYEEYAVMARRVDRMEHSIGSIVTKIDSVIGKLDTMEKARARRRETMSKLLDSIVEGSDTHMSDEQKKEQMDSLVAEELARWDRSVVVGSSSQLDGGAQSRSASVASSRR